MAKPSTRIQEMPAAIEAEARSCSVTDGRFIVPCDTLASVFEGDGFGTGRALFLMELTSFNTLKPSRSFIVLRMGEHKPKGIVLNCCPFCGERIDAPVATETQELASCAR